MSESLASLVVTQRSEQDRRSFGWRTVVYGFTRSRRREHRRGDDADVIFIDSLHPWLFFLAVGTMLLSCADAFMTLILIDNGMYEANPVMAAAMSQSTGLFVSSKMALTGTAVLMLVFLARAHFLNRIRAGMILTLVFSLYCCLICYEIVSLFQVL